MRIRLKHELAQVPTRATAWDAGLDLYAVERVQIPAGEWRLVNTGVVFELPDGYVGMVCPRSGLAAKYGLTVLNAPGIIDSGYRGEVMVNIINHNHEREWLAIEPGDRVAQLVIVQAIFPKIEVAGNLTTSIRGTNGHGSSGK